MGKKALGTKALQVLQKSGVAFRLIEYAADSHSAHGFALDTAEKLHIDPTQVYKTLVVSVAGMHHGGRHQDGEVMALVPADCVLNLKRLAAAAGGKRAQMVEPNKAQLLTGYVTGGISPLGSKTTLPVFIDQRARAHQVILVSAGKRGNSAEINPTDLAQLTGATFADLADQR